MTPWNEPLLSLADGARSGQFFAFKRQPRIFWILFSEKRNRCYRFSMSAERSPSTACALRSPQAFRGAKKRCALV
jgi:hypothetical protein